MKTKFAIGFIGALLGAGAISAQAGIIDSTAVTDFTGGTATTNLTGNNSNTIGWSFQVSQTINVTSLGLFDYGADGFDLAHTVGLYQQTSSNSGTLLGSVVIDSNDVLIASTRYEQLSSPITLTAGVTYVISAYMPSKNTDMFINSPTSVTLDPIITYIGGRFVNSGSNTSMTYPGSENTSVTGRFGPNFTFTAGEDAAVPEVASISILAMAGIILLARRKK